MKRNIFIIILILALAATLAMFTACENDDDDDDDDQPPDGDDDDQGDDDDDDHDPNPYYDPAEPGPYPVGHLTLYLENKDDTDIMGNPRKLVVEYWYPADDAAWDMPQDTIGNFFGEWEDFVRDIIGLLVPPEEVANFDQLTGAVPLAPMRNDLPPMPIVFFSHGNAGVRFQNWTMCNHLASHGYFVVSPDHTGNSLIAPFPGHFVIYNILGMPASIGDRQRDMSFLLDDCILKNEEPGGIFEARFDTEHVAIIGHSFGGITSVELVKKDHRFTAAVDMCCYVIPSFNEDYTAATMYWLSTEDRTMFDTQELIKLDYETTPPPKVLLEVFRGGHYTPTDACAMIPSLMGDGDGCGSGERHDTGEPFDYLPPEEAHLLLNYYATSFFGVYLKEDERYVEDLIEEIMPEETDLWFEMR